MHTNMSDNMELVKKDELFFNIHMVFNIQATSCDALM